MTMYKYVVVFFILALFSCEEKVESIVIENDKAIDTLKFASSLESNILELDASIKGKIYKLVFDTGSPTTLLNSSIPSKKFFTDTVFFRDIVNNTHFSYRAAIDTLMIGKIQVLNKKTYEQRKLNIDGIIGSDIIQNFVWKIDFVNGNVYVSDDPNQLLANEVGIPLDDQGPYSTIKLTIADVPIDCVVDTGYSGFISINKHLSDSTLYPKNLVQWEGISTLGSGNPYSLASFSYHIDTTQYFSDRVSFFNIVLENEVIELRNIPLNIVGMDFFKRFDYIILNFPNKTIHFGNIRHKSLTYLLSSLLRLNTKGLTLYRKGNGVFVGRVNTDAKKYGLHYLDTVLKIDDVQVINRDSSFYSNKTVWHAQTRHLEYYPSTFNTLWNNFHYIKDTSNIEVKRGDSSQVYSLIRQYYLTSMPDTIYDYYIDLNLPIPNINKVKTASGSHFYRFKTEELLPWGLRNKEQLGLSN